MKINVIRRRAQLIFFKVIEIHKWTHLDINFYIKQYKFYEKLALFNSELKVPYRNNNNNNNNALYLYLTNLRNLDHSYAVVTFCRTIFTHVTLVPANRASWTSLLLEEMLNMQRILSEFNWVFFSSVCTCISISCNGISWKWRSCIRII